MNISLFKTFIAVAKHKSITRASEGIYLTQPAITKQLKVLEQQYGIKLFESNKKNRILTEDGKHLLDYAHQIVNTFNESIASFDEKNGQVRGTLKIGVNLTLGIYVLPRLIKLFSDIYPELKIDMFLDNTEHIIRAVKQNDVNFGFIGLNLKDPLLTLHHFYQEKINVVIGPDLGIRKRTISWKDLEAIPFIGRERGSDIRESSEQWLKERNIKLTTKMESNNTEAIKKCIQSGIGFSLLPWCTVEQEVKAGLLRVVSAPHFDLSKNHYICHYKDKRFSKPERVFLEFLFQAIESGSTFLSSTPPASQAHPCKAPL